MPNKAYKFRMYPSDEQKILLANFFGCTRFVYNHFLERKIKQYELNKTSLSYTACANEMAQLKKTEQYSFLKKADSIALQQSLRHLDQAFQNFFKLPNTGFPKFKSKKHHKKSYSTVNINNNISLNDGYIKLPKINLIKIKQHRPIPDGYTLKSATISLTPSGKYYVSILYEYENPVLPSDNRNIAIGLDYSMRELYVDNEGREPAYPRYYRQSEKKIKREQRKLSHMKKGSNNYEKQRKKVAGIHEKIANQRKDFLHKQSRQIANAYDYVCIEDLDMKAMSGILNFGKNIYDNGWAMFTKFLDYKLTDRGKKLVKINKFFASSQICSSCGYVNKEIKNLSIRSWKCPECQACHNRDVNAAINLKTEGLRIVLT